MLEDLYLEKMLNKWGRFAQDQDIYAIIVHHPKTPMSNGTTKVYSEPDVFTLSGGAMWNNKMSNILCYHRPNYFVNPMDKWCTVSSQKIKKQKLNGIPGKVNFLYNPDTMRFMELEGEPVTPSDAGYNPLDDINPSDVSFEVKPPIEEDEDEMPF